MWKRRLKPLLLVPCVVLTSSGCKYDESVKVQNQLDEAVDFSWWDVAPDQGMVVTVRIPPRSTVRFRSGSFDRKDGTGFLGLPRTCGLSYRTVETGREVVKKDALARFLKPPWLADSVHTTGKPGKRGGSSFFILTETDIVVVLSPKEVQEIDTVKRETKPIAE